MPNTDDPTMIMYDPVPQTYLTYMILIVSVPILKTYLMQMILPCICLIQFHRKTWHIPFYTDCVSSKSKDLPDKWSYAECVWSSSINLPDTNDSTLSLYHKIAWYRWSFTKCVRSTDSSDMKIPTLSVSDSVQ